jgi:hypothetical protein
MKKILALLLMALVTQVAQSTEYKHLSELPVDSVIRNSCENVNEFSFLRRGSVNSACFNLNQTFAQLDDLYARRDEFKTEDILAKKDEIKRLAIPILMFENQETINKEKAMIREYMRERFGSEIVDEMDKYSSSYQKK